MDREAREATHPILTNFHKLMMSLNGMNKGQVIGLAEARANPLLSIKMYYPILNC
jgi:hypothetical protein